MGTGGRSSHEVPEWKRRLGWYAKRARRAIDHAGEAFDDLDDQIERLGPESGPVDNRGRPKQRPRTIRWPDADSFSLEPAKDGSAKVRIGGVTFRLPRGEANLLGFISSPLAIGQAPWIPLDEIAKHLGLRSGRALKRHAVEEVFYRLRKILGRAGFDGAALVLTRRGFGARFLLPRIASKG